MTEDAPSPVAPERAPGGAIRWHIAAGLLLVVGVAVRINNALVYDPVNGFDAAENVDYIRMLTTSWSLPAPDAGWSTSHPPLFYYASAAIWHGLSALGVERATLKVIPLCVSLAGLVTIGVALAFVRRLALRDEVRLVLAGALLLFLPVQVYVSAMVGEEPVVTMWMSLALWVAFPLLIGGAVDRARPVDGLGRAAAVGLLGGLALLTKMTGVLVIGAIAATWLIGGLRHRAWRVVLARTVVMGGVAALVGGWFYAHNLWTYGYLYPQDLAVHAKMFDMPPGSRSVLDYLRVPLATFRDPQLLNPDLLRSIWGSTYDTIWFDGHRHFLPRTAAVTRVGVAMTVLGLLPTAAFVIGAARGAGRAWRSPGGIDTLLCLLVGGVVAGYVAFTWGNPWYATVKGSYLLGVSVPFAVYTSETLAGWIRPGGARAWLVLGALGALLGLVVLTFTIGPVFVKLDGPGLPWRTIAH